MVEGRERKSQGDPHITDVAGIESSPHNPGARAGPPRPVTRHSPASNGRRTTDRMRSAEGRDDSSPVGPVGRRNHLYGLLDVDATE